MNISELSTKIQTATLAAYPQLEAEELKIKLEHPAEQTHGDWATNIALTLSKKLHLNPREVAKNIVGSLSALLEEEEDHHVSEINIAGPGFINFSLTSDFYFQTLTSSDLSLKQPGNEDKLYVVEMGDPNTHKFPHIGHLFNYIVGDSVSRIMEARGIRVARCSWQGDIGPHVAKCIFGWQKMGKPEPETQVEKMWTLQNAYTLGNKEYDESEESKAVIQQMNRDLYQISEANINGDKIKLELEELASDYQKTKQWSIDFDEYFEARLGIKLDNRYLEGDHWKKGIEVVKEKVGLGEVFESSQGAVIFPGEKYGLNTRVFITQKNTPTYEAKDIGLVMQKMQDYPNFDLAIIPTAVEQENYFKVIFKAIEMIYPELQNKLVHIGTGMINLKGIKMSSRTGNILTGYDLLETVETKVKEVIENRGSLSETEKAEVTQKVAISAIKYALLRGNILQNSIFDLKESISFEGNSGPYLLYTYARIISVLKQKPTIEPTIKTLTAEDLSELLTETAELNLVKTIYRFSEVIDKATENLSPHLVATYLFDLAQKFNSYYKQTTINSAATSELIAARRLLAEKVAAVLKTGLKLLGIETLEKM